MTIAVLKNYPIFDGGSTELVDGGSIVIEGGRIREVSNQNVNLPGAFNVDLTGRFVMPGLIDIHFHSYSVTLNMGDP